MINNHQTSISHFYKMILIMILSGLLSSMYVWSDKLSDIRFTINDVYMVLLMTAWMTTFMAFLESKWTILCISLFVVILIYIFIRKQTMVTLSQYYKGMIPHHSMAVLMSKELLNKYCKEEKCEKLSEEDRKFIQSIVDTQEKEIEFMKSKVKKD